MSEAVTAPFMSSSPARKPIDTATSTNPLTPAILMRTRRSSTPESVRTASLPPIVMPVDPIGEPAALLTVSAPL
jgi:hypothetical protein